MTTKTRTPKAPKPTYRPEIKAVDAAAGAYTVSSERYTYTLHSVNIFDHACDCDGFKYRGYCKHIRLASEVHAKAHSCTRTGATWQTCPKCSTSFYGASGAVFCGCSDGATAKPHAGRAAGLLAAFGIE